MGAISGLAAATAVTRDDVFLGNDGSTTKKFSGAVMATYFAAGPMLSVASSEAPTAIKDRCDYVCDGTGDQVEINAALAAATGGVQLSGGRFNLSAPVTLLIPGQRLQGTGSYKDSTVYGHTLGVGTALKVTSGFAGAAALVVASPVDGLAIGQVTLRDLTVDGNSVGSGVDGILFRAFQSSVSNIEIVECTGNGIHVKGYTVADGGADWATYDTRLFDLHVSYCDGAGIYTSNNAADLHISNSIFHNNLHGMRLASSSPQVTQIHTYSSTQYGVWLEGGEAARVKLMNSKIEHSGRHGLFCDGSSGSGQSGAQIIGVGFNSNSETTDNTYAHLMIQGNGSFFGGLIHGCQFGNSDSAANTPAYAVDIADATRYLTFMGNNLQNSNGGSHAGVYCAGATMLTTARFVGNIGLTDRGTGT